MPAITSPAPLVTEAAVRAGRRLAPRLDVVARARPVETLERLQEGGASEVAHPPFEAGLEMIRHALRRFGVPNQEALATVSRLRMEHYQPARRAAER